MEEEMLLYLTERGWNLQKAPNGLYYTCYDGKNAKLTLHLDIVDLKKSILLAIAYLPIKAMPAQLDKVARFLNELNLKTYFGSFEMDYSNGEIAFRAGIFYFNTDFQMPMIINCLNAAAYSADMDYPAIQAILDSSIDQ
jgi:hypothetical protein